MSLCLSWVGEKMFEFNKEKIWKILEDGWVKSKTRECRPMFADLAYVRDGVFCGGSAKKSFASKRNFLLWININ